MRTDAICLGELLIDFVSLRRGVGLADAPGFAKAAGGAPANVAVGLARLGVPTAFLTKVSQDEFGQFLRRTLQRNKVQVSAIASTSHAPTGLAFVSLSRRGERDFLFYRNPCADVLLESRDIPPHMFEKAKVFHFGSISLIQEPSRSATRHAVRLAREKGLLVSFDPNLRPPLWPNLKAARRLMLQSMKWAHVIKLSLEELKFLAGNVSLPEALRRIWRSQYQLLVVSLGRRGCYYMTGKHAGLVPGFSVRCVDTTGAGDAFVAGMLSRVLTLRARGQTPSQLCTAELESLLRYANACGALATMTRGAIPSLPHSRKATQFLRRKNNRA